MQEEVYVHPEPSKKRGITFEPFEITSTVRSHFTRLRESKNKNGKRNPETQITGKKARKLSKKKAKLEKLWEVPERLRRRQICRT
jgi:hypothetical protein